MRRYPYKKYLLLLATLFLLLTLPPLLIQAVRGKIFAYLAPAMNMANRGPEDIQHKKLELENHLLRIEIGKLRAIIEQSIPDDPLLGKAIAGRVIYRDPGTWTSSLWINIGELSGPIIQKNSPVVLGRALVGVIDYVGKKQSRVRLITDVGLKPSVRAVRGYPQNLALAEHITPILRQLNMRRDLPISQEDQHSLQQILVRFRSSLSEGAEGWYLAKGILQGSGAPLWRSNNKILKGIGFNYDFPDAFGPGRDLETGRLIHLPSSLENVPIIQLHDLLVTTGMDGVFPPGLSVGEVTKIHPLKEGAYTYEIESIPAAGNLDGLHTLFVIPPVGYDEADQHELTLS
ncbi:MAG: rod shape-determining protein MreC [Chlamydiales bacterium]